MNKIEKYKEILKSNFEPGENISFQILSLIKYYESRNNLKALDTIRLILDSYSIVSKNGNKIEIQLPKATENKINTLYMTKINTFRYGAKNIEDLLDDLINEND